MSYWRKFSNFSQNFTLDEPLYLELGLRYNERRMIINIIIFVISVLYIIDFIRKTNTLLSSFLSFLSHFYQFVTTVAFCNKIIAFCNKTVAFCNKIAVAFSNNICRILLWTVIMNQIWNLVSSNMLMLCWMSLNPGLLEGGRKTDPLRKRNL